MSTPLLVVIVLALAIVVFALMLQAKGRREFQRERRAEEEL